MVAISSTRRAELDSRNLSELLGTIYDAALDPGLWPAMLARYCAELDAKAASVHVVNPVTGQVSLFVEHGTSPEWTELLLTKYARMSPIGGAVLMFVGVNFSALSAGDFIFV
jgi:hypothetical protein